MLADGRRWMYSYLPRPITVESLAPLRPTCRRRLIAACIESPSETPTLGDSRPTDDHTLPVSCLGPASPAKVLLTILHRRTVSILRSSWSRPILLSVQCWALRGGVWVLHIAEPAPPASRSLLGPITGGGRLNGRLESCQYWCHGQRRRLCNQERSLIRNRRYRQRRDGRPPAACHWAGAPTCMVGAGVWCRPGGGRVEFSGWGLAVCAWGADGADDMVFLD
ncbi:unnamed protein product [Periconia digitata]|uniref:Uncharacterized protein n=1 Tax=Periconia digitata TaxID=1303443 RepID=A0A9W4XS28_9PLEO|nr:unnamed protein product [Periconia digitata]